MDGRRYSRAEFEKHFGDDGLREWESGPKSKKARTRILGRDELMEELELVRQAQGGAV